MARSQAEMDRREGRYQVEAQRGAILEAAERVFLEKGLEHAQMVDIAAQAGITKVTLYRYFANLDAIALEVQVGSGVYSFVYAAG